MIRPTHPSGSGGYVGVPHGVGLKGEELFYMHLRLHGGPAPVPRSLSDPIREVWERKVNPDLVFDFMLPFSQVAEGYRAMDERHAIKILLRP